jgi:preprotein translocase subunit SecY
MVLLKNFKNIFLIPELAKRILFTIGVLAIYRLGTYIPLIGINIPMLADYMQKAGGLTSGLFGYIDMLSGGALQTGALFALGINPYITASIMMQMLSMTVPSLEVLQKEGEYGRKIINQYTRYLTLGLSIVYGIMYISMLTHNNLMVNNSFGLKFLFVVSLVVGAMLIMWFGEQITLMGIGNGSSLLIFAGIVARFPADIQKTVTAVSAGSLSMFLAFVILAVFMAIAACIVFLEKGDRKIPIQYARRIIGQRVYGGQSTYIPFKINTAGVMPVIFASSILQIPIALSAFLGDRFAFFRVMGESLGRGGLVYNVLTFGLIVFFTYVYTALIYNPAEIAENIKKGGGFIPGIRPGKQTADFFDYILTRVGLVGALYLGTLALMPWVLGYFITMPFVLGGTSLLIVVGVALDTSAQIESYLIEHRYDGFLSSGRIRGRVSR